MTISEPQEKIRVEYIDDRPVVSARELHEALGIHTIFRQWFPRMCEYGFMEGLDYTKIYQKKRDPGQARSKWIMRSAWTWPNTSA